MLIAVLAASALAESNYSETVLQLKAAMQEPDFRHSAFGRLAYLVDTYGSRLWGSPQLQLVIKQLYQMAKQEGFDNVRLQPVTNFTRWIRNDESLVMTSPRRNSKLDLSALGYSVGGFAEADAVVVHSLAEIENRAAEVKGKIVVMTYNWTSYYDHYELRSAGPSVAAKHGAVGFLFRSLASKSIYSVHTGFTEYDSRYKKIPAAAITVEDAEMIQRMVQRGQRVTLRLNISTSFQSNCNSSNLVFQIKGSQQPEKILLMGGHIDSWDTGSQTGTNDDGGGVITVYEALRLLLKKELRPKRTLRFIAWSGEESGQDNDGAAQYVASHKSEISNHVLAFESDLGSTRLKGFGLSGAGLPVLRQVVGDFLGPLEVSQVSDDGEAVDTTPLFDLGVPQMKNLIEDGPNSEFYFQYHHSAGDSLTMMDPEDMDSNVVGIAAVMYILGDLEQSLR